MQNIQVNRVAINYNISLDRYNLIIYLVNKELELYSRSVKLFGDKNILLKRSFELINAINNAPTYDNFVKYDRLPNYKHRFDNNIETNLEKCIFINNFVFPNNEQFINSLKKSMSLENIKSLINAIIIKKKEAKNTNDYELNIENICDIDNICKYYGLNNKEIIINKIIELYNMQYDLFDTKKMIKKR